MQVSPNVFLLGGHVHADMTFLYWNWVAHYYGIGNEPNRDVYTVYDMVRYVAEIPVETDFGIPPPFPFSIMG